MGSQGFRTASFAAASRRHVGRLGAFRGATVLADVLAGDDPCHTVSRKGGREDGREGEEEGVKGRGKREEGREEAVEWPTSEGRGRAGGMDEEGGEGEGRWNGQ
eukprot:364394-Chlamydomonas_euryale.AAC.2